MKWTFDLVRLSAIKYETKSDWYKSDAAAYKVAHRKKWIEEVTKHMVSKKPGTFDQKEYDRLRYLKFKDKKNAQSRAYYLTHKKNKCEYQKKRRTSDPIYRLKCIIRCSLNDRLRGTDRCIRPSKYLGCSVEELKKHLESKFQPGMTWDNHGLHGWHIDHIKPLASFDLTDLEQVRQACHYTNLQPLWAKDNLRKGANV